jgi:hypothetical protein
MSFEWLKKKDSVERPDKKVEKMHARRDKIVEQLHNPEMEECSNKFFDASVRMAALGIYEGGAEGPYKEEYAQLQEEYDRLLRGHEKDLFLYSIKKYALMEKNKMVLAYKNHWRYIFMRPKYIRTYASELGTQEKAFLIEQLTNRLKNNLDKIIKDVRLRESIPGFRRQGYEEEKCIDETQSDTESLQAFIPLLDRKEHEQANRLIARSNEFLPKFIANT